MQRQQLAEGELIGIYRRLIAVTLIAVILGVFAYRYFSGVNQMIGQGTDLAYNRFLNVLVVVRSQWLAYGKPKRMELDWKVFDPATHDVDSGRVLMSAKGSPLPDAFNTQGCERLWSQLMGKELTKQLTVEYLVDTQTCRYVAKNSDSISYQLSSGRVLYIPKKKAR